jgi:catechol 2,3-dioxygenase-like lactoylglutathione lyase family enzyme
MGGNRPAVLPEFCRVDGRLSFGPILHIKVKRLDHIQLSIPAGSEADARRFYTEILGLTELEKPAALKPNGGLWFAIADVQLHLGIEANPGKVKRHPAFEVENLEQVKTYLRACHVEIKEEIPVPGIERFSFFDPFGNRIEFMTRQPD